MRTTHRINVGDGAVMAIPNPIADPAIEWQLRYGESDNIISLLAAELISSYEHLLSSNISAKESIRRLKILRSEVKKLKLPEVEDEMD